MPDLLQLIDEYMKFREARGFQPNAKVRRMLRQFVSTLDQDTEGKLVSNAQALAWATAGGSPSWNASRFSVVRGFVTYLAGSGLPVEVPARNQIPSQPLRATPYLYSQTDIRAVMDAATALFTPLKAATMQTLTGILSVTGMRIGEALSLLVGSINADQQTATIVRAKFGNQRVVVLHESTCRAITTYLRRPDRRRLGVGPDRPLLVTRTGGAMSYSTAGHAFQEMVVHAQLAKRPNARPRAHDLRHTFATRTMIDAYANGADPARVLALLALWLGHVNPADTFWYLEAAPEVAAIAARRLEPICEDGVK